jgi:hypothetical protein
MLGRPARPPGHGQRGPVLQLSLGLLGAGLVGGAKRIPATAISASQRRTQLDLSVQLAGLEQC